MAKRKTGKADDPATPDVDESVEEVPEEAAEVVEEVADPKKHILVDVGANGTYSIVDQPEGWMNDRVVKVSGRNCEHVGDDVNGVWQYRSM